MKKLIGILVLVLLSGCYTPADHYSVHQGNKNSALATTYSNGFGIGTGQKSVEYAIYNALKTCQHHNPNELCTLKKINGRTVYNDEANEWRDKFNKNERFLTFALRDGGYWITADTGERYKEPTAITKKSKPKKTPDDNKIMAAASGSGFYINSSGYAITNNHVIDGCRKVSLNHQGKNYVANIIATDFKNDLAIIKSNVRPSAFYKISQDDVKLLDDVIIAGYPLGKSVSSAIKTSKGSITALAGYGDNYSNFQTDAALNQGNSGGPIINRTGSVVGVAVANFGKNAGVESFNFGIKSSTLKAFISSNNINIMPGSSSPLSNKSLGDLITKGTVYIECWLTVADIKRIIAEDENRKAIYSKFQ